MISILGKATYDKTIKINGYELKEIVKDKIEYILHIDAGDDSATVTYENKPHINNDFLVGVIEGQMRTYGIVFKTSFIHIKGEKTND